jgi:FAD/FMN-containing dehydrogenase
MMTAPVYFSQLRQLLGPIGFLEASDDCARYSRGARYGQGRAAAVARPASHEEVQRVLSICAEHRQAVVVQGANTGLVAASTPDESGTVLVLSLERLRATLEIDVLNRSVRVDAGVTLHELNDALAPHGLFFPIDLGANPSVGGMLAANTGGSRLIKYGDVRTNCLGLQVALMQPQGASLMLDTALRKNNTGPDLKHLFIGSSGAYGVITQAQLQVHRLPKQTATALVIPKDQAAVLSLLQTLEENCGDFLSAFEGISGNAFNAVLQHIPNVSNPFAPDAVPEYSVLIELSSTSSKEQSGIDLEALLMNSLEVLFGDVVENAVIGRAADLWKIRHSISEAIREDGKIIAFDISVPRSSLLDFRRAALQLIELDFPYLQVMDFGHWADGGFHFNLIWPHQNASVYDPMKVQTLRDAVYAMVVNDYAGSFSAEHGVGPYNLAYYHKYVSSTAQKIAGQWQLQFDPQRLLGVTWFGALDMKA